MRALKFGALASFIISLSVLLLGGYFSIDKIPPYPEQVKVGDSVNGARLVEILPTQVRLQKNAQSFSVRLVTDKINKQMRVVGQ